MTHDKEVERLIARLNGWDQLYGDGVHDDTKALQHLFSGHPVLNRRTGKVLETPFILDGGTYLTKMPLMVNIKDGIVTGCNFRSIP